MKAERFHALLEVLSSLLSAWCNTFCRGNVGLPGHNNEAASLQTHRSWVRMFKVSQVLPNDLALKGLYQEKNPIGGRKNYYVGRIWRMIMCWVQDLFIYFLIWELVEICRPVRARFFIFFQWVARWCFFKGAPTHKEKHLILEFKMDTTANSK